LPYSLEQIFGKQDEGMSDMAQGAALSTDDSGSAGFATCRRD